MVCGGFTCSKNVLSALNIFYILVSFILIGVGAYARLAAVVTSVRIVGGLIACGVFLWMVAIMGLYGTCKHSQVILFFYMIILFLIFLIQFAIAVASLALNKSNQATLLTQAWAESSKSTKIDVMHSLQCCGFKEMDLANSDPMGHPPCNLAKLSCCDSDIGRKSFCCVGHSEWTNVTKSTCPCNDTCWDKTSQNLDSALKIAGTIGLFFSFTEIIGVWLALRFRNLRNPSIDPSAFL